MIAQLAPRDRRLRRLALTLAALCALSAPARAAPAALDTDADVAAFAERVRAYAGASLVRWTIVAPTRAEAQAKIDAIVGRLPPSDRSLAARLVPQEASDEHGARGYISPQIGATGLAGACSWQVWVSDPALPAASGQTAMVPLASHDRLPVSPKATFRVGHFGLVQSKLYAFDETQPGAIRDLSTAPAIDIPVPKSGPEDYIVLATARTAAPFLDGVKAALATSQGERRDLGPEYALRERLLGAARGIGANIEAVPSSMIARKPTKVAAFTAPAPAPAANDEALMETCLYALTPSP
jgi:hypothetical protein